MWGRVLTLVVSLWFVAVATTPELGGACPMHGSHKPGDIASIGGGHHQAVQHNQPGRHNAQCTCPDQCCCTSPVALLSLRLTLAEFVSAVTRATGLADYDYVPVAARHLLPLAHAPPQAA